MARKTLSGNGVNRRQFLTRASMGAGALMFMPSIRGIGENFNPWERQRSSKAWSFGVMADTQWTLNGDVDDGYDPNSSTVYIAEQIQQAFINAGVSFVIHVGDLHDNTTVLGEQTRALYAQSLYNAGIGFFPVRGNHDDSAAIAAAFQTGFSTDANRCAESDAESSALPGCEPWVKHQRHQQSGPSQHQAIPLYRGPELQQSYGFRRRSYRLDLFL